MSDAKHTTCSFMSREFTDHMFRNGWLSIGIWSPGDGGEFCVIHAMNSTTEAQEIARTRARLFVAAPDLLEAAYMALDWVGRDCNAGKALRVAIAKATGSDSQENEQ